MGWELKGVPVRVEVGPRDLADGNVTVVTRHTREKQAVALGTVDATVAAVLATAGPALLAEATAAREARTADAATLGEAVEAGSVGFARVRFGALGPAGEDRLGRARADRPVPAAARRLAGAAGRRGGGPRGRGGALVLTRGRSGGPRLPVSGGSGVGTAPGLL